MTDRRVRILLFEPYLFDQMYGNMRYLTSMVRWYDRRRFVLDIATPRQSEFAAVLQGLGANVFVIPPPAKLLEHGRTLVSGILQRIAGAISVLAYTRKLSRFLRSGNYDIVHCHSIRAVLTIGLAAKLNRRPIVWYVKGMLANPVLDALCFALASRILFQGSANRDRRYPGLVRLFSRKIGLVPNGIELDEVRQARADDCLRQGLGISGRSLNLATVGQVSPAKGQKYLLEALALLKGTGPAVSLYVVGGPGIDAYAGYVGELQTLAKQLGLQNVHFLGWRDDVYSIVAQMDIVVHPSLEEGVPKAVIEAMALGRPVIATRVGSVPDLIEHNVTGLLVDPCQPDQIAAAVKLMAEDRDYRSRLADAGLEFVLAHCSIEANVRRVQGVWTDLGVPAGKAGP